MSFKRMTGSLSIYIVISILPTCIRKLSPKTNLSLKRIVRVYSFAATVPHVLGLRKR